MVEKHSPSDSHTYNKLQKSAAALSIAATALMAGCSRSAEVSAQSDNEHPLNPDMAQSVVVEQQPETNTPAKELYRTTPTQEWVVNKDVLVTNWDSLSIEERELEVQNFFESNIEGLDMHTWERTPEGLKKSADNMREVYRAIMRMSFDLSADPDAEVLLSNIISTLSGNDEVKADLTEIVHTNIQVERENITKTIDQVDDGYGPVKYNIIGSTKTSDNIYINKKGEATFTQAFYTTDKLGTRYDFALGIMLTPGKKSGDPGCLKFRQIAMDNGEYDIVVFGYDDEMKWEDLRSLSAE